MSVPVVDGLAERKVRPDELFVDTAYGSGRNAFKTSRRGTELVSPVAGSAPGNSHEGEGDGPPPLTAADFQIDVTGEQATVCPAGHPSHRGVRVGGCAGAGRGPLCQDNMRALPLAVPLPSEAGPACGGLRPQGGPGEGKHRAAPEGRGHRGVAQAVCHKGRDRGNELRAEARPTGLGACGCEGAVGCGLPST